MENEFDLKDCRVEQENNEKFFKCKINEPPKSQSVTHKIGSK